MSAFHQFAETYLIPATLASAMLGMGATLTLKQFTKVFRDPRGLLIGVVLQLVVIPLIAFAFVNATGLSGGWAIGIYLIAVVPGGAFSNLLTFIARGNTPLSISMTIASTASCVVTLPIVLGLLAGGALPADFQFPAGQIIFNIVLFLLIPLAVGMALQRGSKWFIRLSVALLSVISLSSVASGRLDVMAYGLWPPFTIVMFGLIIAVAPSVIARVLGREPDDVAAIGIEITVRNIPVGLLLVGFFFPGSEKQAHVLYSCLLYGGLSMLLVAPLVVRHRLRPAAPPANAAAALAGHAPAALARGSSSP